MRKAFVLILVAITILAGTAWAQQRSVTVTVASPADTPSDASLYITGNADVIGNWDPGAVRMNSEGSGRWTYSFKVLQGTFLEFKITLGSWQKEAIYRLGVVPGNWTVDVVKDTILSFAPISWGMRNPPDSGLGITGELRSHKALTHPGLRYPKDVFVWLPPSYTALPEKRYPVLYMHDGQNVFDPSTSFIGYDWRADETADSLIRAGAMQEVIIVALTNSPDRTEEYSDSQKGKAYAEFLVKHVKPFIDSVYRTLPDREHTGVMGSSMGGLISFLVAWWYPDVFSMAGCLSPAFSFDDSKLIADVQEDKGPKKKIRLYIDNGTQGLERILQKGVDEMLEVLPKVGYEKDKDFVVFIDEGAVHNEVAWAHRLWRPLLFLFPAVALK